LLLFCCSSCLLGLFMTMPALFQGRWPALADQSYEGF
jgi:hypothetical protein